MAHCDVSTSTSVRWMVTRLRRKVLPGCSSGMWYWILVSILHYSPPAVQPRKPFVQEISRKKDRTVFQCPPYIFPYILSPYVMHVLYLLYGGLQYLYMVPAQIYSMYCCTEPDLRSYHVFSAHVYFLLIDCHLLTCICSLSLVTTVYP